MVRRYNAGSIAELAAEHGLPDRVVSALYAAAVGDMRRTTYQSDESHTRDQAIGDVQALARAAHLAEMGAVREPMVDPYRDS